MDGLQMHTLQSDIRLIFSAIAVAVGIAVCCSYAYMQFSLSFFTFLFIRFEGQAPCAECPYVYVSMCLGVDLNTELQQQLPATPSAASAFESIYAQTFLSHNEHAMSQDFSYRFFLIPKKIGTLFPMFQDIIENSCSFYLKLENI